MTGAIFPGCAKPKYYLFVCSRSSQINSQAKKQSLIIGTVFIYLRTHHSGHGSHSRRCQHNRHSGRDARARTSNRLCRSGVGAHLIGHLQMSPAEWLQLQEQLWSAFAPLISWFLVFLMVGLIGIASTLFGSVFFSDWLNNGGFGR